MSDRVELEIKGPVAYVRLNRPEKHNGMDFALLKAVVKTAQQLKKNREALLTQQLFRVLERHLSR